MEKSPKLENWLQKMFPFSLQTKLIILYIFIIIVPTVTFIWYYSNQLYESSIEDEIKEQEYLLETEKVLISQNMESMRRAAQVVISDKEFISYLESETPADTAQLINLINTSMTNISRSHYNNPAIEHVRIYTNNQNIMEIWPMLFNEKRVTNAGWYPELIGKEGLELWWYEQFDRDIIDRQYEANSAEATVSLFREIEYLENQHLGAIQISMLLKNFIPKMYNSIDGGSSIMLLFDHEKNAFYNRKNPFFKDQELIIDDIEKLFIKNLEKKDFKSLQFYNNKIPYLMVSTYIEPLDSYLLNVISMEATQEGMTQTRTVVILVTLTLVSILSFVSYKLISRLLKNMYMLMDSMKAVEKGNFDVNLAISGPREISLLATYYQNMLQKIKKLIAEMINKEAATKEAELRALKTQIDSHFLYNTLENIKMMAEIEEKYEISDALTSLGEMMRYNLKWKKDFVLLKEELDHIRNYIDIMNLRLNGKLKLQMEVPKSLEEQEILKMSLQPIVENAVKHGISPIIHEKTGIIDIVVKNDQEAIEIQITDNGVGISPDQLESLINKLSQTKESLDNQVKKGNGIGLENVNERIHYHYGKSYGIGFESKEEAFTRVIVRLPLLINRGG